MRLAPSLSLLFICLLLGACVPKAQYNTLLRERDYYREQTLTADSLATLQERSANDSLRSQLTAERQLVRRVEDLTATNLLLKDQLVETRSRYEALFAQNSELLAASGSEVVNLQRELIERRAELDRREAATEQRERQLQARETQLNSLERPSVSRDTPVREEIPELITLRDQLQQVMLASVDTGYLLSEVEGQRITLTLTEPLLFAAGELAFSGRQLLRRIAATLRRYPTTTYTLIGYTDEGDKEVAEAYRESAQRAALVAARLIEYGIDPARIVAGGQGFYGAEAGPQELNDPRRTELVIRYLDGE